MPKRPRDFNELAKLVVDIASGEVADTVSPKMRVEESKGRAGGLVGGKARALSLTSTRRREIAQKGAKCRWNDSTDVG